MLRDQSLKFAILLAMVQDVMKRYQPEYLSQEIAAGDPGQNYRIQEVMRNKIPRYEALWKFYHDYP